MANVAKKNCILLFTLYFYFNYLICTVLTRHHKTHRRLQPNPWELSGELEGDILVDIIEKRHGLKAVTRRWSNNTIPFEFHPNIKKHVREHITEVLKDYEKHTCLKVIPRTSEKDYAFIVNEKEKCSSHVGRIGGKQYVYLSGTKIGKNCLKKGTILHEFMHAAGFSHQHKAVDRDNYVDVIWENIIKGATNNFVKAKSFMYTSFGLPYDYSSVMHYSRVAFSKNGNKTLETKDPKAKIGQREGFSKVDIMKLRAMYSCPEEPPTSTSTTTVSSNEEIIPLANYYETNSLEYLDNTEEELY